MLSGIRLTYGQVVELSRQAVVVVRGQTGSKAGRGSGRLY